MIEYPPHAVRELSPMISAVGILGIRCAIGVSKLIPESGDNASEMKFTLLASSHSLGTCVYAY